MASADRTFGLAPGDSLTRVTPPPAGSDIGPWKVNVYMPPMGDDEIQAVEAGEPVERPYLADEAWVEYPDDTRYRQPFTYVDEEYRSAVASFYDDDERDMYWRRRLSERDRDTAWWAEHGAPVITTGILGDLWHLDGQYECEEEEAEEDADGCIVVEFGSLQLEALGRRLYELDHTFWPRLRKLGPVPGLVTVANQLLHREERARPERHRRPRVTWRRSATAAQRSRGRCSHGRSFRARRASASRGSPPSGGGDDGGGGGGDGGPAHGRLRILCVCLLILLAGASVVSVWDDIPWEEDAQATTYYDHDDAALGYDESIDFSVSPSAGLALDGFLFAHRRAVEAGVLQFRSEPEHNSEDAFDVAFALKDKMEKVQPSVRAKVYADEFERAYQEWLAAPADEIPAPPDVVAERRTEDVIITYLGNHVLAAYERFEDFASYDRMMDRMAAVLAKRATRVRTGRADAGRSRPHATLGRARGSTRTRRTRSVTRGSPARSGGDPPGGSEPPGAGDRHTTSEVTRLALSGAAVPHPPMPTRGWAAHGTTTEEQ